MKVRLASLILFGLLSLVFLACRSTATTPSPAKSTTGGIAAVDGVAGPRVRYTDSWTVAQSPVGGFSVRVPAGWTTTTATDGVILYPPDVSADGHSPVVAFSFDPSRAFEANAPTGHATTLPQPISVAGVQGRWFKDGELAIPTSGYTIELPVGTGTLTAYATTGPVMNLQPQLTEILKGLTLPAGPPR